MTEWAWTTQQSCSCICNLQKMWDNKIYLLLSHFGVIFLHSSKLLIHSHSSVSMETMAMMLTTLLPESIGRLNKDILEFVNQKMAPGTFWVVQWLRLPAATAGGLGSIPGHRTRSRMLQLRVHMPQLRICMLQLRFDAAKQANKYLFKNASRAPPLGWRWTRKGRYSGEGDGVLSLGHLHSSGIWWISEKRSLGRGNSGARVGKFGTQTRVVS